MPSAPYASITGASQGPISQKANTADSIGNSYQESHTDEIIVLGFETHVEIPTDPQSGQPAGVRKHMPAELRTCYSKASPMLWQALANGEVLQIEVGFYRTALTGQQEKYYTIKYTDCLLVDGRAYVPDVLDEDFKTYPHMEAWRFTYRAVDWTHEKAGTSGSDDWRSPASA